MNSLERKTAAPRYGGYTVDELREYVAHNERTGESVDMLLGNDASSAQIIGDLLDSIEKLTGTASSTRVAAGTRITFSRSLSAPATGDHPALEYARAGEHGQITGYNDFEGYWVKTDTWPHPFGAQRDEFSVIPGTDPSNPFQARVQPWMLACFGAAIAADRAERNHRFFEEAGELVQACGMTADEAHQLVNYTWSRPLGEKPQEVGGVMVTLAALCLANQLDMHAAGETELARVWTKIKAIRRKQAAKPKHSPLPIAGSSSDAGSP